MQFPEIPQALRDLAIGQAMLRPRGFVPDLRTMLLTSAAHPVPLMEPDDVVRHVTSVTALMHGPNEPMNSMRPAMNNALRRATATAYTEHNRTRQAAREAVQNWLMRPPPSRERGPTWATALTT